MSKNNISKREQESEKKRTATHSKEKMPQLNEVVASYVQIINGKMPEKCSRIFSKWKNLFADLNRPTKPSSEAQANILHILAADFLARLSNKSASCFTSSSSATCFLSLSHSLHSVHKFFKHRISTVWSSSDDGFGRHVSHAQCSFNWLNLMLYIHFLFICFLSLDAVRSCLCYFKCASTQKTHLIHFRPASYLCTSVWFIKQIFGSA